MQFLTVFSSYGEPNYQQHHFCRAAEQATSIDPRPTLPPASRRAPLVGACQQVKPCLSRPLGLSTASTKCLRPGAAWGPVGRPSLVPSGPFILASFLQVSSEDAQAQFLVPVGSLGKNRAEASLARAQDLNPMVDVKADPEDVAQKPEEFFAHFDVVRASGGSHRGLLRGRGSRPASPGLTTHGRAVPSTALPWRLWCGEAPSHHAIASAHPVGREKGVGAHGCPDLKRRLAFWLLDLCAELSGTCLPGLSDMLFPRGPREG